MFECEWFDEQADLIRKYLLTYFPRNQTIEMFDLKTRKMFLKRMACGDVTMDKLFLGGVVTVYSRQLKLVDYGDAFTRSCFAKAKESSFLLIKPDAYVHTGKIIDHLYRSGFMVS